MTFRLTEANLFYKQKAEKMENEVIMKNMEQEHMRQKIGLLENQIKQLRETEINLRMAMEESRQRNSARGSHASLDLSNVLSNDI